MTAPLGALNADIGMSGLVLCLLGILLVLFGARADRRTVRYFLLIYTVLFSAAMWTAIRRT